MIDWIYTSHASIDLRMAAVNCQIINNQPVYTQTIKFGSCNVQQISPFTNLPVCYTT
jgi:sodium/potassium-transporting ATPase subunit alpha